MAGVRVERIDCGSDLVQITVSARQLGGGCGRCGAGSTRVHSPYDTMTEPWPTRRWPAGA